MTIPSKGPYNKLEGGKGKRGALSTEEMDYIRKNIINMDTAAISKELGKSIQSIEKFAYKENLVVKQAAGTGEERNIKIRRTLRGRDYWPEIKMQFMPPEIKIFEYIWVQLYIQFNEDVLMSEELQMKKYITLEILKHRCLKKANNLELEEEKLQIIVDEENAKPKGEKNIEAVRKLVLQMAEMQSKQFLLYKEYREMGDKQKDIEKALKISRDDRIKGVLDSTQNWTGNVRLLNENPEIRDVLGKHIEIMKMAQRQEEDRLMELHTFIDKSVDYLVLSKEAIGEEDDGEED